MLIRVLSSLALTFTLASLAWGVAPPSPVDAALLKKLLRKLDHDNFDVRQAADQKIRALGDAVLPRLRRELNHTRSLEVRWRLTRIIEDLSVGERIEQLVRMLGDADQTQRQRADWSLRKAGLGALPLLKKELRPEMPAEQRQRVEQIIRDLSTQLR